MSKALAFFNISKYPLMLMLALLAGQFSLWCFVGFSNAAGYLAGTVALLCFVIGVLLIIVASMQFRSKKTTVNPTQPPEHLVTSGLFRLSRNPMYVGMLLMLFVQPLLAMRPYLFAFSAMFFLFMNYFIIPREERVIEEMFGDTYRAYQAKVRRWL